MIFDGLAMLNALWGFICVAFTIPALSGRHYRRVGFIALMILVANTTLLYSAGEKTLADSMSRSAVVALLNVSVAFLFVHFIHRKRSVTDLFRFRRQG